MNANVKAKLGFLSQTTKQYSTMGITKALYNNFLVCSGRECSNTKKKNNYHNSTQMKYQVQIFNLDLNASYRKYY